MFKLIALALGRAGLAVDTANNEATEPARFYTDDETNETILIGEFAGACEASPRVNSPVKPVSFVSSSVLSPAPSIASLLLTLICFQMNYPLNVYLYPAASQTPSHTHPPHASMCTNTNNEQNS